MTRILLSIPVLLLLVSCGKSEPISTQTNNSNANNSSTTIDDTTAVNNAAAVADTQSVSVTTQSYSSGQSFGNVQVTVSNVPDAGLYSSVAIDQENTSIAAANFAQSSGTLSIKFASGASVGTGTHLNEVALTLCYDEQCTNQVDGSPIVINTNLNSVAGTASVAAAESVISVESNATQDGRPEQSIAPISVSDINPSNVFVDISEQSDEMGISEASHRVQGNQLELLVDFTDPQSLSAGSHSSTYLANICYDSACAHPLEGSPLTFNVNYEVSAPQIDTGTTNPDARTELNHDVIDAEYSAQLNAVAIASSSPRNAVYIYNLDDLSDVNEIPLDLVPTAITVANAGDSNKIAVGHDARVTFIEFDESDPTATSKKVLSATIDVYDLTATDSAIYAVPRVDQWEKLHRIDVSDNSITESNHPGIRAASKIKMHPHLKAVYLADRGLSPSDIEKIDIQTTPPTYVSDSPYHGDHAMCGDLWMGNEGNRIYTACGNTFKASEAESQDMIYTGKLPLLTMDDFSNSEYRLRSVAESSSKNEIVALESDPYYNCESNPNEACTYTLSYFSKDFLSRVSTGIFGRVGVAGSTYVEKPAFVFYNDDGTSAFAISQLMGIATQKSYILEYNR